MVWLRGWKPPRCSSTCLAGCVLLCFLLRGQSSLEQFLGEAQSLYSHPPLDPHSQGNAVWSSGFALQLVLTRSGAGGGHEITHPHHLFNRPHRLIAIAWTKRGALACQQLLTLHVQLCRLERISRSTGWTCASSLYGRTWCWTQFGAGGHWELKLRSGASLRLTRWRKRALLSKFSLKRGFLGTSDQEISGEVMALFFQPDIQFFFLKMCIKKTVFSASLLLRLITKISGSAKAAAYLSHCSRFEEGSRVSLQPGEQQKLVLYKWQAATNHLPFTPSPWMGLCAHMESRTQSLFSARFMLPRNLRLSQQWRGGIY